MSNNASPGAPRSGALEGPPARVLVVDDEPRNRKLLEGYLRPEGYQVTEAADGPSALDAARAEPPDVVLLDVMMPEMTGHQVCRSLKADPRTRLCQIMLVTALAGTSNAVEGLDTGADDYVTKPVRREEFLAKVRALVRLSRLLRELERARMALAIRNEELQLKRMLAQTLVHDLKSPLAAILANLELLRMSNAGESSERMIERSRLSASRMLEMIMNLLDVEKLEEGRLVPRLERVDLVEVGRAGVEEARAAAKQKRLGLELRAGEPAWVDADAALLRRVVDNLIANATSHAPPETSIEVRVSQRPEGVELTVSDRGPGVSEDQREAIFEKYAKQDESAGRSLNRGLGLTFCRLAVEVHGGTIWVDGAPGGGACFHTLLPESAPLGAEDHADWATTAAERTG